MAAAALISSLTGLALAATLPCGAGATGDNARWVRPEIGTAYNGHTFVAAAYPFGMLQPGPDTGRTGWDYCSGYRWDDTRITGFSQTHLNGTGCADLGDIRLMPFSGAPGPDVSSAYRKETQAATPGYYAVTLDDCGARVEATVTERCAIYRMSWPKGEGRLLVDCQYGIGGGLASSIVSCDARPEDNRRIVGTTRRRCWVDRRYSFVIEFDRPFVSCEILPKASPGEKAPRFALSFDLADGAPLLAKIGYSTVDTDGARRNLGRELPGFGFDDARLAARDAWNRYLSRADADGTDAEKQSFYTALYHAFIQPNNIADVDGRYRGADGKVAVAAGGEYYSTLSLWDTYRAANPLYTLVVPEKTGPIVATMVEHWKAAGFLPIWTLMGRDNQCMIGSHAVPVIVDAYLKGFGGFDPETAYAAVRNTLRERHEGRRKENWDLLDKYGYYPNDIVKSESVARLLECAYDDWCASVFAERLGRAEDAEFFRRRSGSWRNVLDPETGFVRGRDTSGAWTTPFDPFALGHDSSRRSDFTEGNSWQWTWHVMQDPEGLVAALGGREKALAKLLALFEESRSIDETSPGFVLDVTGLVGQYAHGNEPSHHVVYFFQYLGRPDRTAELVREIFDKFYLAKPDGLCGNDDCGQMSAWYVFSSMGFYPFNPCGGEYVIGAPQLPCVRITTGTGRVLTVKALNLSRENKYVKSVSLDGRPLEGFKLRHADIAGGGELVFEMGPRP